MANLINCGDPFHFSYSILDDYFKLFKLVSHINIVAVNCYLILKRLFTYLTLNLNVIESSRKVIDKIYFFSIYYCYILVQLLHWPYYIYDTQYHCIL